MAFRDQVRTQEAVLGTADSRVSSLPPPHFWAAYGGKPLLVVRTVVWLMSIVRKSENMAREVKMQVSGKFKLSWAPHHPGFKCKGSEVPVHLEGLGKSL